MQKFIFILSLFLTGMLGAEETCISCHESFKSSCNLQCADCHESPNADYIPILNEGLHPAIIKNPSTERWWDEKCISCHKNQITSFQKNSHYSLSRIINQTRYLWGKTGILKTGGDPDDWKKLIPESEAQGHTMSELVDNLLSKKCMACHFNADAKEDATGRKRNAGCAACHIPLDQNSGKPLYGHIMQKTVSDTVCLSCHSGNYVGGDYYGYFEHDYHTEYNMPYESKPLFGAYQHRLSVDIHKTAGLRCMDCHKSEGVMGKSGVTVTCEDCHGGFNQSKKISAKPFNKNITSHNSFHKNVSCTACHAQWSYQDYGMHLFLDESNNHSMWSNTIMQGDYQVTRFLNKILSMEEEAWGFSESANRLSGEFSRGIWYKGWTFRRWEEPILGIDDKGKYSIIRPLYQYYITYVDSNENVWLDSAIPHKADGTTGWSWDAYSPHTIGKSGRNCESCHENSKAVGLGIRQNPSDKVSHKITLPSPPIVPGTRLLNESEIKNLLNKSSSYKKWRAREFKKQGIDILF